MKIVYRGFELEAKRDKCLAGYSLLYYTAYRIKDGWGLVDSFGEIADSIRKVIASLKKHVDRYYETKTAS